MCFPKRHCMGTHGLVFLARSHQQILRIQFTSIHTQYTSIHTHYTRQRQRRKTRTILLNWGLKTRFSDNCARLPSTCVWNCSSCLIVQGLQQTYNAKIVLLGLQWSYNTTRRQRLFRPCLDFNCYTIQLEDKDCLGPASTAQARKSSSSDLSQRKNGLFTPLIGCALCL